MSPVDEVASSERRSNGGGTRTKEDQDRKDLGHRRRRLSPFDDTVRRNRDPTVSSMISRVECLRAQSPETSIIAADHSSHSDNEQWQKVK